MKDKKYSFRIRENDEDIEEILSSLSASERSDFIRNAIRFYAGYKDRLDDIDKKLDCILKKIERKLENLSVSPSVMEPKDEEKQRTGETEKLLIESVMDILSL
ncbi:hypothetical protein O163_04980 [Caldanaerobacter subterraneus subsp. yonseiensis KB-1]|uniref:Uncharacterized protein n=1 Tax=Caldanaerobacter subterraneus subsp. yonseiensis KB-1 TaxID=1388761 RepID=U5CRW4_CALSX|nr:hypothetical protein [Caldanaerobacter subterraneus]ERM92519.1 hypothetical protein O163_04980 [Caldanaerobacter subterraneus subsp. yonseiensis KB-1]